MKRPTIPADTSMFRNLAQLARRLAMPVLLLAAAWATAGCDYSDATAIGLNKGYKPVQPISYSHKIHAGDLQIECKYCHFGAEKSKKAGIPPLSVCMNCHKSVKTDSPQIQKLTDYYKKNQPVPWVKVHNLPDYVSFDHSRHVLKGVACQTCHGNIQDMAEVKQQNTLAMGWCVNCHREYTRNPPPDLKDRHIFATTDCTACHQ